MRVAPAFHEVTTPVSVLPMMASWEDATIAASRAESISALRRSVRSASRLMAPVTRPLWTVSG